MGPKAMICVREKCLKRRLSKDLSFASKVCLVNQFCSRLWGRLFGSVAFWHPFFGENPYLFGSGHFWATTKNFDPSDILPNEEVNISRKINTFMIKKSSSENSPNH